MNTIDFITESNRIEGITRPPTQKEIDEHDRFMELPYITINELCKFVDVYQPNATLRDLPGLNVRVGNHVPISGGPAVRFALEELLENMHDPFITHVQYETLHPFTDCNGRSGRALWAWLMKENYEGYPLGFLHHFYYQALSQSRIAKNG